MLFQHSAQKSCTWLTITPILRSAKRKAKSTTWRISWRPSLETISALSPSPGGRTSTLHEPFVRSALRALRRDRAARMKPELFLLERAFADCLERLEIIAKPFGTALLLGCSDPAGSRGFERLRTRSRWSIRALFAAAAGGSIIVEDVWAPASGRYGLILAIGTLDSVDDLPGTLRTFAAALEPGGMLIGAMSGGDTLPLFAP